VTIAVLDSGIKWNDLAAMQDLRKKFRLNRGELPQPSTTLGKGSDPSADCSTYSDGWDANGRLLAVWPATIGKLTAELVPVVGERDHRLAGDPSG
jgi:hypothetical protein